MSSIPQKKAPSKSSKRSSNAAPSGLTVELKQHSYRIDISSHDNGPLCDLLETICTDGRALILTNSVVGPQLVPDLKRSLRARGMKAPYLILPDGERNKNLETVQLCYDWLLDQGADRHSVLVLVGGGVLGDIGGFVAATFMRGIRYVQVPTTLVSQVDSSVGGKVGVDHKEGKNLIGAFYQPNHVHIDVGYLETLPDREFLCGLAEVIKYAIIYDAEFFKFLQSNRIAILQRDTLHLEKIVQTCCQIKADIVSRDEKETIGERMTLNFGHTVGHAVERLTEYRKFGHGEAVSIGMIQAARISEHFKYCSSEVAHEVADLIAAYGLPIKLPKFSKKEWEQSLKRDKKMRGDELQYVFVEKIGRVKVKSVDPKEIAALLKA